MYPHIVGSAEERDTMLREQVFPSIASGNTILFLGAGASVTEEQKFLSSNLMEYHKAKEGFEISTDDITEYIDVLSKNPRFDRRRFDDQVAGYLRLLQPAKFHSTIARLPWKEIITTNYDLLVERAHDSLRGTSDENYKLIVARDQQAYRYRLAADEVVYVKLNGCISDPSAYPLVFSSADFERARRFYQVVLQALENLSPKIQFLSIGYSFSDPFAQALLKRFDRFNYRNRREMLLVDPLVQAARLPALAEVHIRRLLWGSRRAPNAAKAVASSSSVSQRSRFPFFTATPAPATPPRGTGSNRQESRKSLQADFGLAPPGSDRPGATTWLRRAGTRRPEPATRTAASRQSWLQNPSRDLNRALDRRLSRTAVPPLARHQSHADWMMQAFRLGLHPLHAIQALTRGGLPVADAVQAVSLTRTALRNRDGLDFGPHGGPRSHPLEAEGFGWGSLCEMTTVTD
jgi:hypothetical protein